MKEYVQHFSTRIPWKDNGFSGKIDNKPQRNMEAQVISNIAMSRDLEFEELNKGKLYSEVGTQKMKSWITENASFMCDHELRLMMNHPYKKNNEKFKHFEETIFKIEPFSFLLRPFSWALKKEAERKSKYYNFHFDLEKTESMLDWEGAWVSHGESQKSIFEYFFSGIRPNKSIIFPYYKAVPFIEDNRRVIAGIGNLTENVTIREYASDDTGNEKNYIWETSAQHSIREEATEGFMMPYVEIYEYAKKNPGFDINDVTIFEADGFRDEFSYAAEWVSYDATINVLNQAKKAVSNLRTLDLPSASASWINTQLEYLDNQLSKVWDQRGIYPGLGSMLSAFKVDFGFDIARYIDTKKLPLMSELALYFSREKRTGDSILDNAIYEKADEFKGIRNNKDKANFFELLSRINLTLEQAFFVWNKFKKDPSEILKNPYMLYELTRMEKQENRVSIFQIDNGMYVNKLVVNNYPLQEPMKMETEGDKRRFRAMMTYVLSLAAEKGHTLLSYENTIQEIKKLALDQRTDFEIEKIDGIIDFLKQGDVLPNEVEFYLKLKEYVEYKKIISDFCLYKLSEEKLSIRDWQPIINTKFGNLREGNEENDKRARSEKSKALSILESSTLSVLLGGAGTGKTEALGIFSSEDEISKEGILALAPTGKARVQLESKINKSTNGIEFMTVAQFLRKSEGFDGVTQTYKIPTKPSTSIARTVIIDESSMLTEEMFAGIIKLVKTHARRIIFVGDPNQLPPIGAGRPFVDLINYLKENHSEHIAELKTEMRQGDGGDDLAFAQLFSNSATVDKDVISRIQNSKNDSRVKFVQYQNQDDFEELFIKELSLVIEKKANEDDITGFNSSLGASIEKGYTHYKKSKCVEEWQILSPTKLLGVGSFYLNDLIHQKFRKDKVDEWNSRLFNQPRPQSIQNIVYGDKVISNVNKFRKCWGANGLENEYIANGEIGIMSGYPYHYGKKDKNKKWYKFRFKSFEGKEFSYVENDFGSDKNESILELAYALTVHKSQGSGFNETIVVINGTNSFITKELLYTAFSRHKKKLIILSDLSLEELMNYSQDWHSNIKQRYTDLFDSPEIVLIEKENQQRFYEEKLIHRTSRGEMVRSKSEVIVANILCDLGVEYEYENDLNILNKTYIPDFTIKYKGKSAYLEHLGMLENKNYKHKWEIKKSDYESVGISESEGNLLITKESVNGGIDSKEIESQITKWMHS